MAHGWIPGVWPCRACDHYNPPHANACLTCRAPRQGLNSNSDPALAAKPEKQARSRRRTPAERMNKSEREIEAMLSCDPMAIVLPQALTLSFVDGTSYRPDFLVIAAGQMDRVIEVKGGYRGPGWEQGIERYRRAKEKWGAWFRFELWTKKSGKWEVE